MGYVILIIGSIVFLIDLYLALVSLNFQKKRTKSVRGYLTTTKSSKDVYKRGNHFYKHYVTFVYNYRVNGKLYQASGGVPCKKGNLPSVVEIIYQKWNPKLAYVNQLSRPIHPFLCLLLCPIWVTMIVCAIHLIQVLSQFVATHL